MKASSKNYICDYCNKQFSKPSLLRSHIVTHTAEKPFQCPSCDKCFSQKSSLHRHDQEIHKARKPHKCFQCGICFTQKVNLQMHLKRVHSLGNNADILSTGTPRSFPCNHCSCVFKTLNVLNRHKSQKHLPADALESEHYAKLAVDFDENTPVNDADELTKNVLEELKKLQKYMTPIEQKSEPAKNPVVEERSVIKKQIRFNRSDENRHEAIIEDSNTQLIQLVDKLNPMLEPRPITVQRIERSDGFKYYICEFCSKEFRKTYDIIRHRRIHIQEAPYKCDFCNTVCITKTKLEAHKRTHTISKEDNTLRSKQYTCKICQENFYSIRKLDIHTSSSHSETHSIFYKCLNCERSFGTLSAFMSHKHRLQDKEYHMIRDLLPPPIKVSSTNDFTNEMGFKCPTCGRIFSNKSSRSIHYKIYVTHKKYNCQQCKGKSFPNEACLRRHLLVHSNQRIYKCAYCVKMYKNKAHCRQHMVKHLENLLNDNAEIAENNIPQYKPKECMVMVQEKAKGIDAIEIKFDKLQLLPSLPRKKQDLNDDSNHPNNLITSQEANITEQVAAASLGSKHCTICNRSFKKPCYLQRHLRVHTKERPFACDDCNKTFTLKSSLKEHKQTHGEQRNKINCQVCDRRYSSHKALVIHLRIHTGERPFKCRYCDKAFRTSGHLHAHNKTTHNLKERYH